ncbi:hypothetical protein HYH02_013907 [Chlamydomonas schloesseri]|uniref:F-box domain-containing protein n=1 Tax=Chlamydomonas schloesseri TaxID=2026947 RepID=A0A835VYR2_9CHLO|nr:hypothetical protein HYH02_013907 [Chlamydomonas schloesseri]|eukprot:KAG2429956.1 hypothetical protein HYH02_013907 [Chlamydomonas schloesseri]
MVGVSHVFYAHAPDWRGVPDAAWDIVLGELSWSDIASARAACRDWSVDVNRCLQRLHVRDPSPDVLVRLGAVFPHLHKLKLTAWQRNVRLDSEGLRLPGAMGRVGSLRLRSKQPGGGLLAVGRLALLRGCSTGGCSSNSSGSCSGGGGAGGDCGQLLRELSLRACDVASWRGVREGCGRLQHLQLVHCRFATPEAAHGLTAALTALPRLITLELRCATRAGGGSSSADSSNSSGSGGGSSPTAAAAAARRRSSGGGSGSGPAAGSGGGAPPPPPSSPSSSAVAAHCVLVPDLTGLGAAASGLTALRLAVPLDEATLNQLLWMELPRIRSLRELELGLLQPVRQGRRRSAVAAAEALPPPPPLPPHLPGAVAAVGPHVAAPGAGAQHGAAAEAAGAVLDGENDHAAAPLQAQHPNHQPLPPPPPHQHPPLRPSGNYRELAHVLPAIVVGAPHLTCLKVKGHSRVRDRDLLLLSPLRQLRHLSLDLPPGSASAAAAAAAAMAAAAAGDPHAAAGAGAADGLLPLDHDELLAGLAEAGPGEAAHGDARGGGGGSSLLLTAVGVAGLLRAAPQLTALSLAHAAWAPEGLAALAAGAGRLTRLRLCGVDLPNSTPLCGLLYGLRTSLLPHLVELDLSGCGGLSDWGLAALGRACGGGGGVAGGGSGGVGAAEAGRLQRLQRLVLRGCGGECGGGGSGGGGARGGLVGDVGVAALAPVMGRLRHLDVSFMDGLTDTGLHGLLRGGGAPHLASLCISFCGRVTDAGVVAIAAACPALVRLEMDYCVGVTGAVGVVGVDVTGGAAAIASTTTTAIACAGAAAGVTPSASTIVAGATAVFNELDVACGLSAAFPRWASLSVSDGRATPLHMAGRGSAAASPTSGASWLFEGGGGAGGSSSGGGVARRKGAALEHEVLPPVVTALQELRGLRRVSAEGCSPSLVAALRLGLQPAAARQQCSSRAAASWWLAVDSAGSSSGKGSGGSSSASSPIYQM